MYCSIIVALHAKIQNRMIKNLDKILMVISEILNQLVHLAQNN